MSFHLFELREVKCTPEIQKISQKTKKMQFLGAITACFGYKKAPIF